MVIAYWIIVLLISGQSVPGTVHYPSEEVCESAAKMAVGYKATCVPIYKEDKKEMGDTDPPLDFDCGVINCQERHARQGRV